MLREKNKLAENWVQKKKKKKNVMVIQCYQIRFRACYLMLSDQEMRSLFLWLTRKQMVEFVLARFRQFVFIIPNYILICFYITKGTFKMPLA